MGVEIQRRLDFPVKPGLGGLGSDDLDRLDWIFCFRSCGGPTVDTEVFIQVPARQDEQEAFARGRRYLTAWAEQKRSPERVELPLSLVRRRSVSVHSLTPEYSRRSSLWW